MKSLDISAQQGKIDTVFHVIEAGLVFLAAFALMAYIQFNPNNPYLSEFDSYYHVKMAEMIRDRGFDFSQGIFYGITHDGAAAVIMIFALAALFGLTYLLVHKNKLRWATGITIAGAGILVLNSIFIQEFPWLYYTTLHQSYVNHHLLFHILMIPFLQIFGTFSGAKLIMIASTGIAFLFFYLILKELKVPGAVIWSFIAVFTMSSDFYYRLNFIKAIALSLGFLVATMYYTFKGKHAFIALLSFLYVWSYGGFTFLPIFGVLYFIAQILCKEQLDWKAPVAILGGTALGLMLNPYFPENIQFLFLQIFQTGLGAQGYVGGEWADYESFFWLTINIVPVVFFLLGIILTLSNNSKQNAKTVSLVMMSMLFLFLVWKSKRFVEYSPFFLSLAGIAMMTDFLQEKAREWKSLSMEVFRKPNNILYALMIVLLLLPFPALGHLGGDYSNDSSPNGQPIKRYQECSGIAVPPQIFNFAYCQIQRAYRDTQTLFSMSALTQVHNYLLENSQQGDIVFTDDWDVFPRYFFANSKNYFLVGLDPEFMNQYDGPPYEGQKGRLYQEFAQISSGNDPNNLERIKDNFKAKWVIVNTDHQQFCDNLKKQPQLFEEVLFATNDETVDNYPAARGDSYYLFKVL